MKTSYHELRANLSESLIQLLWDQWTAIGGAGGNRFGEIEFPIDPEALVLATSWGARDEPRLFEMCFDWLAKNGKLVSVQRLKNIQRATELGDGEVLSEIAEFMLGNKHPNWKSIADSVERSVVKEDRSFSIRNMSRKPRAFDSGSFIFKLRGIFGMSARAEVFFWLLTHESGHAAAIARDTFWLPKTVQVILNEWEDAGMVSVQEGDRERVFRLDANPWEFLIHESGGDINWRQHPAYYSAIKQILETLERLELAGTKSEDFYALTILESINEISNKLDKCGLGWIFRSWKTEMAAGNLPQCFISGVISLTGGRVPDVVPEYAKTKPQFTKFVRR